MADNKKTKKYDADSIKSMDFGDHVKLRWTMYCNGIEDLFMEVMNNALDQIFNGWGDEIKVIHHKNGAWSIEDNSTGIPIGWNKKANMSTQDSVFLMQSTGGKFSADSFQFAVGSMGTGLKILSYLGQYVKVKIKRDGEIWEALYDKGATKNTMSHKTGKCPKTEHGTYVEFLPDEKYFKDQEIKTISVDFVKTKCKDTSYLFPELKLSFEDKNTNEKINYENKNGLKQFIFDNLNSAKQIIEPIVIPLTNLPNGEKVEIVLSWINKETNKIVSFCNLLKMLNPGTEVDGFLSGLYDVLQNFANQNKDEKTKDTKFDQEDIKEGLFACINCYVPEKLKLFQGQTKTKLLASEIKPDIRNLVISNLTQWLKVNKQDGLKIIKNIYASRDARKAAERAKISTKAVSKKAQKFISDKYSKPQIYDPKKSSLIIVEGDSAKSTVEKARTPYFGIYPIRGKLPSAETTNYKQLLQNEEVKTIASLIGTGIGEKFDIRRLAFKEIIILADADP